MANLCKKKKNGSHKRRINQKASNFYEPVPYKTICTAKIIARPTKLALIKEAPFAPGMLGFEEGPEGTPLQLPEGDAPPEPLPEPPLGKGEPAPTGMVGWLGELEKALLSPEEP